MKLMTRGVLANIYIMLRRLFTILITNFRPKQINLILGLEKLDYSHKLVCLECFKNAYTSNRVKYCKYLINTFHNFTRPQTSLKWM